MENLGGFDPSTMTYFSTQIAHPSVGGSADPFQEMLLPMDMLQSTTQHTATQGLDQHDPEAPSIDRDNKLLSFSPPAFCYTLLDYTYRRTTLSLAAQLHGMFFLAESPWASAGDAQAPPSELTCYRRNLFQITGEITLPRTLRYIMTEQGEQIPIVGQELVMSATESTEGNNVKIISVPWKTPANPSAPTTEDKAEREPPSIPLDLMNVQEVDSEFATFPFQWKRLQFRIATANNGRRKELQQHFVVRLKVLATLATGGKIPICEVGSAAIIVRGRSPRNFQSRKDLPLNGSSHVRKASHLPGPQAARSSSNDSVNAGMKRMHDGGPTSAPIKAEGQTQLPMQTYLDTDDANEPPYLFEWNAVNQAQPDAVTGVQTIPPTTSPMQGGNVYAVSSPDIPRVPKTSQSSQAPVSLSLVEDDSPRKRQSETPSEHHSAKRLQIPARPPSFSLNTINSPDESADLLYEYFPLGLDDWHPPVDAVYRPHVVHHTKLPTDPRDPNPSAKSARSKRYFSQDVT
ncbi:hypothetical protein LTR37_008809 [Vermiconidia calcicola]|uniref:Uncharacterized protein n=1 Tax=Vermiconidia calcicola TaxID=1690605 RepID=A0ACC3N9J1_9PEZI|nr:hypothetical protein LTR37_008809 [Vermiconidia calcicola]